jgi:hypothetical protein
MALFDATPNIHPTLAQGARMPEQRPEEDEQHHIQCCLELHLHLHSTCVFVATQTSHVRTFHSSSDIMVCLSLLSPYYILESG